MIANSCDESCALSSGWSAQPLTVESINIARRKNIAFLLSFFGLALVVVVFWVSVRVSVFCSILTLDVPSCVCRAETPWSCREREGG